MGCHPLLPDEALVKQVLSRPGLSITNEMGVRLLYQYDGAAWVRDLLARRGIDLSDGQDTFGQLYGRILSYHGEALFHDVLEPAIPVARDKLQTMQYARTMSSGLAHEHSYDLYALSRVNARLLLTFQPQRYQQLENRRRVTLDEYTQFFLSLGFEISRPDRFSPFFHEIVCVDQVESGPPVVKDLLWPVVMFGDLLFSRAGVRIESGPEHINKDLAENSKLYFAYWRLNRAAQDLSSGWGHNSQWRTSFHPRSYATSQAFHYNVDGKDDVNRPARPPSPQEGLSREQRIELLTHRCWVLRKPEGNDDWFPYRDRYTEMRANCRQTGS